MAPTTPHPAPVAARGPQRWIGALADPALVCSSGGWVQAWNPALEAALGWSSEETQGELPPFLDEGSWRTLLRSFSDGEACHPDAPELEIRGSDGRAYLCRLEVVRLADGDRGSVDGDSAWLVLLRGVRAREDTSTATADLVEHSMQHQQNDWLGEQIRRMAQRAEIFERVLHRSPGILMILRNDEDLSAEYVSSNIDRFGYGREALVDGTLRTTELFHPEDLDRVRTEVDFWCRRPEVDDFRLEYRWVTADGLARWMDTHLWLRRDAEGRVRRMQGIAWDITDRKRAEARQRLAMHVVEVLNCPHEIGEVIESILEILRQYADIEAAAVHLRRDDRHLDCHQVGFGERVPLDPIDCALTGAVLGHDGVGTRTCPHGRVCGNEIEGIVDRSPGGSLWVNDTSRLPCAGDRDSCVRRTRTGDAAPPLGSVAVVPLRAAGEIVGALQLCDGRSGRFDADTVEAFESLGYSIGIAIDREVTTRRLRASEERYRTLFDTAGDGIVIYTIDGRIEAANSAFLRMVGRGLGELREAESWEYSRRSGAACTGPCLPGILLRDGYTNEHEGQLIRPDRTVVDVMERSWMVRDDRGTPVRRMRVMRDVSRQREVEREVRRLATAIEQFGDGVIVTDTEGRIEYVNPAFERASGYRREEAVGTNVEFLRSDRNPPGLHEDLWNTIRAGETFNARFVNRRRDGRTYTIDNTVSPVFDSSGRISGYVAVQRDVTELMRLEMQLLQAQKLESIGRLAAGIAHEINTPSQYVGDNVRFLQEAFADYGRVLAAGRAMATTARERGLLAEELQAIQRIDEEADFEFLEQEIPRAIEQSLEGLSRIGTIVGAMKHFSHPGANEIALVDIHRAIESTVTVARNEWKYDAELRTEFDESMPLVPCLPNELNQVVLNLVINAVHAIQERQRREASDEKGTIVVRTLHRPPDAVIEVADTGTGIGEDARAHVFDPFFTTKRVGQGTGQGLALAHDVVVNKHGGAIEFETESGVGTTFRIRIPLVSPEDRKRGRGGSS